MGLTRCNWNEDLRLWTSIIITSAHTGLKESASTLQVVPCRMSLCLAPQLKIRRPSVPAAETETLTITRTPVGLGCAGSGQSFLPLPLTMALSHSRRSASMAFRNVFRGICTGT